MRRALGVAIAAIGAAVGWFVLEVWRICRDQENTTPIPTPDPDEDVDEDELDRLAYAVVGMPTYRPDGAYSLLI